MGGGLAFGLALPTVALVVANAGSVALAALAVQLGSEALFVVGFGAAFLAPFALRTGTPSYGLLGPYGLIMIGAALVAALVAALACAWDPQQARDRELRPASP